MSKSKKKSSKIDDVKMYSIAEALKKAKELAVSKFDETVEIHIRLGIDAKKGDQQVRGVVVLPNSFGKQKRIAAFVPEDKEKEAKEENRS